jgi:hypothetical protein
LLTLISVGVGTRTCFEMGWAWLLFAGTLFPPGAGAVENLVPRRLVEEPYRYVRKPLLYVTDFA